MTSLTEDRTDQFVASEQPPRRAGAGPAMPTWAVLASLGVALVAAIAFFITGPPDRAVNVPAETAQSPQEIAVPPTPAAQPQSEPVGPPDSGHGNGPGNSDKTPAGRRDSEPLPPLRTAAVDVYNNSAVTGLAAQTSTELRGLGWTVAGEDNWYGAISSSTVYYPAALVDQAQQLAKDLGIARVRPAVSPMSFDRLTLILTSSP